MLEELAERIEKLDGPDREVDAEIFNAIGAPLPKEAFGMDVQLQPCPNVAGSYVVPMGELLVRYEPPAYSASLDAAMSLVPEGALWAIGDMEEGPFARLVCRNPDGGFTGGYVEAKGRTGATSLCAAALRALAKEE